MTVIHLRLAPNDRNGLDISLLCENDAQLVIDTNGMRGLDKVIQLAIPAGHEFYINQQIQIAEDDDD